VVLIGLVILAGGLYLVSGGLDQWRPKNELTILFDNVSGLGGGDTVLVSGQKAGKVKAVEPADTPGVVEVVIEVDRKYRIREDADFRIRRSITNVVTLHVDGGQSSKLAAGGKQLRGEREQTFEDLIDKYARMEPQVRELLVHVDEVILDIQNKVKEIDVQGMQGQARDVLTKVGEAVAELQGLIRDNREPVGRAIRNLEELSARLNGDWGTMNPKVQGILDDARRATAEVKGILEENRERIKSILQQFDDAMPRVAAAIGQLEGLSREAKDIVAQVRPDLVRAISAGADAMKNLQATVEDLRSAPWKLVNKPSDRETDNIRLYNAARRYVDAAGRVALAVQDLETLRRLGVLGNDERSDLVERTLASMEAALAEFDTSQKAFTSLITKTADDGK
jgi:ABC-type transporter Mla subunit MlaD